MQNAVQDDLAIIGIIGKTFGIKGWVKIHSYTEPLENIFNYHPLQIHKEGRWQDIEFTELRLHGKGVIGHIKDLNTPEEARLYSGLELATQRDQFPQLGEGEYYWSDLEGLTVITTNGSVLGKIDYIFETGANDVLVVKGDKERFIPYIFGPVIKRVDLNDAIIEVDWDPEL